jgi:hypothetical protein
VFNYGFTMEGYTNMASELRVKQTLDEPCEDEQPRIHEHEQMHVDVSGMLCFNDCH